MEEERRRIVIPIGDNPEPASKSESAYFDTQSRENAQPVVPISGTATTGTPERSGKLKVVVVFLVTAIFAGVAAGLYVYLFRGGGGKGPQAAVQPVAGKTLSTLPWTHTPEDTVAQEDANTSADENKDATDKARDSQARSDRAADGSDQKGANKQARTKPAKKKSDKRSDDPVKRTEDQLHRIREIFEGTP